MRMLQILGSIVLVFAVTACGSEGAPASGAGTSKPAGGAPSGAATSAPASAGADADLSKAGAEWAGYSVKAPAGAVVGSDGAGGVQLAMGKYQVSVYPGKPPVADFKAGTKAGVELVQGKITYVKDTADEVEFVSDIKDVTGAMVKNYGFITTLTVGGKPHGCSCSDATSEADLAAAKAICKSLAKK